MKNKLTKNNFRLVIGLLVIISISSIVGYYFNVEKKKEESRKLEEEQKRLTSGSEAKQILIAQAKTENTIKETDSLHVSCSGFY